MSTHLDSQPDTSEHKSKKSSHIFRTALRSKRVQVGSVLAIIAFFVVLSFFLPSEGDSSNVTGDPVNVTVVVTGPMETLTVQRSQTLDGVEVTVTSVAEAKKFSDDRKRAGNLTVRVFVQEKNTTSAPIGIDYASLAHLILPSGEQITPKYVSISPAALPGQVQRGYIDFPLSTQTALSTLHFRLGSQEPLPLRP